MAMRLAIPARSRRFVLAARLCALALVVAALPACSLFGKEEVIPDDPADKLYNEGLFLLNNKRDYKQAAKRFEEVERQHPYSEWARKALLMSAYAHYEGTQYDDSVIAAEQAYRKRSGLPLLSEEDMAALRAGEPMPWERGDGVPAAAAAPSPATPAPAATPPASPGVAPATSAAPAAASAASSPGMTETVKALLASYPKWSKSAVAAEQARRKR